MPDFKALTQQRRTLRTARKQLQPPPKIPDAPYKIGPIDMSIFETQKVNDAGHGDLTALPSAPAR